MKYLCSMLFYNIVIGSTVMMNKEHKEMDDAINDRSYIYSRAKHKSHQLTVVDIHWTLFSLERQMFRPSNLLQIGITTKNSSGALKHMGINAVKSIHLTEY